MNPVSINLFREQGLKVINIVRVVFFLMKNNVQHKLKTYKFSKWSLNQIITYIDKRERTKEKRPNHSWKLLHRKKWPGS